MRLLKDVLLYFSAFVPMYLLIQVKVIFDLIFDNLEVNWVAYSVLIFFAFLIVLGITGLLWNIKWDKGKSESILIKDCKNITDQHFLGNFSIFILFSLGFDLTRLGMLGVFSLILFFVGVVYVSNKLFYINPFLNLLGFNFYEITYEKAGESEAKTAKMFYRGKLEVTNEYRDVKLKNDKFSFIDKNSTKN